jgi:sRNA-binding regulator protein Hfq
MFQNVVAENHIKFVVFQWNAVQIKVYVSNYDKFDAEKFLKLNYGVE